MRAFSTEVVRCGRRSVGTSIGCALLPYTAHYLRSHQAGDLLYCFIAMTKKTTKRNVPKTAASAGLPPSTTAQKLGTSSILRSAFVPSHFQLSLFASVIRSLDSDRLRIHDTVSGAVRCEYSPQRTQITCLDWGYYGQRPHDSEASRKKRRKLDRANGVESSHGDVVVALGTSHAEVELYSPAEAKVVATLANGHAGNIINFKFQDYGKASRAWSLGGDDKLIEWDVLKRSIIRFVTSPLSKILLC